MSCGCPNGSKCGCKRFKSENPKDISYICLCGKDISCNLKDISYNCLCDICNNYIIDLCNNYMKDISCNAGVTNTVYNVNVLTCKTCNKLLTNNISLAKDICDCSYSYSIYTGDISCSEFEIVYYDGMTGPTGPIGPIGSIGPIGPTGPTGMSCNDKYKQTYMSIYSMKEQYILVDDPIIFEEYTAIMGDCLYNIENSNIYIWKAGYYLVNMNIYTLEPCQFSIVKNMLYIIKGSTIGSISGSSQNTHTFIMQITEDDIVTEIAESPTNKACVICVVNSSSINKGVNLYGSTTLGTPISQITASFTMMCIE